MDQPKSDEEPAVDLFGMPSKPLRDPRGRRPAIGNASIRKEIQGVVMSLRAAGLSRDDIAEYLRLDPKTVEKYFSRELTHGAMLLEAQAIQVLVARMNEGNVSAAKAVREIAGARAAPRSKAEKPKAAAPIGKKDQLRADAKKPSPGWGDLLN